MTGLALPTWKGPTQPLAAKDWPLAQLVDDLWRVHFADIPRPNHMVATYGFPWKRRLGRIRMTLDERESEITLNGLLHSAEVPDFVRVAIITHEIVHYAQGFGSPLPRQQTRAHACGCVTHALADRGLDGYERLLDHWAQTVWPTFSQRARATRRPVGILIPEAVGVGLLLEG